jgi:hypothetical protein
LDEIEKILEKNEIKEGNFFYWKNESIKIQDSKAEKLGHGRI